MAQTELTELCLKFGVHQGDWDVISEGGSSLRVHHFENAPHDFLRQAETDLLHETTGSDQNAFTNAKRAIACVMDQILFTFGYQSLRWNTAKKVQTIVAMGIVAPRIIGKVNSTRNLLEHSYRRVSRSAAEDGVDIATLFVESASAILRLFPGQFFVATGSDGEYYAQTIDFWYREEDSKGFYVKEYGAPWGTMMLTADDASFPAVIALALAADRGIGVDRAMRNFQGSIVAENDRLAQPPKSNVR
ncbi:hypothetical protein [Psychromicrobium lacuslunae]|uniref:hypothetical protein n=1 Tax=Psychromicrobium lacuslunae TaxID=1618207 RepID=UPI000AE9759E|nr:hypothetical protein [Psychromicrobium lacuslunae]